MPRWQRSTGEDRHANWNWFIWSGRELCMHSHIPVLADTHFYNDFCAWFIRHPVGFWSVSSCSTVLALKTLTCPWKLTHEAHRRIGDEQKHIPGALMPYESLLHILPYELKQLLSHSKSPQNAIKEHPNPINVGYCTQHFLFLGICYSCPKLILLPSSLLPSVLHVDAVDGHFHHRLGKHICW